MIKFKCPEKIKIKKRKTLSCHHKLKSVLILKDFLNRIRSGISKYEFLILYIEMLTLGIIQSTNVFQRITA